MKSYPQVEDLVRPVRRAAMPRAPRLSVPGGMVHVVAWTTGVGDQGLGDGGQRIERTTVRRRFGYSLVRKGPRLSQGSVVRRVWMFASAARGELQGFWPPLSRLWGGSAVAPTLGVVPKDPVPLSQEPDHLLAILTGRHAPKPGN